MGVITTGRWPKILEGGKVRKSHKLRDSDPKDLLKSLKLKKPKTPKPKGVKRPKMPKV